MDLRNKKILIIAPHPDDEIISTGGLILKAKELNSKVNVLFMTVGLCRQLVTGKTEPETRIKEIEEVSKFCGYEYKLLFKDKMCLLDSLNQKQLIDPIEDYIEETKPDIIILPRGNSFDQDHRAIFKACITALRPRPQNIRHFVPYVLEAEEPYSWCIGELFKPNFYLSLNEELINKKVEALKLHKTQYREDPYSRSGENIKRLSQLRGCEIGITHAETYKVHRGVFNE